MVRARLMSVFFNSFGPSCLYYLQLNISFQVKLKLKVGIIGSEWLGVFDIQLQMKDYWMIPTET